MDRQVQGVSRVNYLYTPANVTLRGGRLSCDENSRGNGAYLYGVDNLTAIVDLNINCSVVVSGRYSGCVFRVVQTGPEAFVCLHIYNPGGNPTLLDDAERYVRSRGWRDIATLGSSGLVQPGRVDSVWFVCELSRPGAVRIARLDASSTGEIVNQFLGEFPGHNRGW